jgi:ubiquinone/menaquinone biosynthesis C-methylase UbiE
MKDLSSAAAQFSLRAEKYVQSEGHARSDDLEILLEFCSSSQAERCLDVATGPGHTAFKIAPFVRLVVGLDISRGMITRASDSAVERGVENCVFMIGDCHDLPFADKSFGLVTCRIAPHHFVNIQQAINEIARCLRPSGRFVLEDSLAPNDSRADDFLNSIERFRDSTHIKSLNQSEWNSVFESSGLSIIKSTIYRKSRPFKSWGERGGLNTEQIGQLVAMIKHSAVGSNFSIVGDDVTTFSDEKIILCCAPRRCS